MSTEEIERATVRAFVHWASAPGRFRCISSSRFPIRHLHQVENPPKSAGRYSMGPPFQLVSMTSGVRGSAGPSSLAHDGNGAVTAGDRAESRLYWSPATSSPPLEQDQSGTDRTAFLTRTHREGSSSSEMLAARWGLDLSPHQPVTHAWFAVTEPSAGSSAPLGRRAWGQR